MKLSVEEVTEMRVAACVDVIIRGTLDLRLTVPAGLLDDVRQYLLEDMGEEEPLEQERILKEAIAWVIEDSSLDVALRLDPAVAGSKTIRYGFAASAGDVSEIREID